MTSHLLARTFFRRMFESDLMPAGHPQVQLVIWSMAFLAAPGLLLPSRFAVKYNTMHNADALVQSMLVDRLLFVTFSMTALGLVALVIWEGVFPDRRDARILTALPLRGRDLILARLAALAAVAGIFLAGVNAVPTFLYGPVLAGFGGAANGVLGVAAHLAATASAGAFVFFGLIAVQGALLNLVGRQAAERLSVALQTVLVIVLLQMIFFLPWVASTLRTDLRAAAADPVLRWLPSIWFLGLYDTLDGIAADGSSPLAAVAVVATAGAIVSCVVLFAATHARLTRRALETIELGGRSRRLLVGPVSRLAAAFVRRPVERATFAFTIRTLIRSRQHRMILALYVGIALALVISAIVPVVVKSGVAALTAPGVALLSAPLVLIFLSLVGIRSLLAIPVEPKARWVVRLHEPGDRLAAMSGVLKAMLALGVIPFVVLAASTAGTLLGPRAAILHGIVCAIMGLLLVEVLASGLYKIPFTCTFLPGRSRLRTMWPLYFIAFTNFCYTTAALEVEMIEQPSLLLIFAAPAWLAIGGLAWYRRRSLLESTGFRFEEEDPDAMFGGFQLSEGLASQTRTPARS